MASRYMERCLILLIIREGQISTAVRYHLTFVSMAVTKKLECLYSVGGNVKWYNHYGKQYGDSFKK